MTTDFRPPPYVLSSPDAVVAAVPYLVGFTPHDSAVVLWLGGRRLRLTQRVDLPASSADPGHVRTWASATWRCGAATGASQVIVVLMTSTGHAEGLVTALVETADEREVDVLDILAVAEGRWRSLLCGDACCPGDGTEVDASVAARVAAEFAVLGVAPLADREALVASLAHDAEAATRVAAQVRPSPAGAGRRREQWRDRMIAEAVSLLLRGAPARPLGDDECARLAEALADIRCRDTVLWDLCRAEDHRRRGAVAVLVDATRRVPEAMVPPVATCAAIGAWLCGDGARARVAVERALASDAHYSLARLVGLCLDSAMPPEAWREAMRGLTRADCRHGTGMPDAVSGGAAG